MTTSRLKRSHVRCNVALCTTNAASIVVLHDITLVPRLVWLFQLRSIHSNPRDLNLDCWKARIPWTKTYQCCQFWIKWLVWASALFCWKTYGLPDATVSIYGFITSITNAQQIGSSHGNQRLTPFNDCGDPRGVFFRVILPHWYTGTFVGLF